MDSSKFVRAYRKAMVLPHFKATFVQRCPTLSPFATFIDWLFKCVEWSFSKSYSTMKKFTKLVFCLNCGELWWRIWRQGTFWSSALTALPYRKKGQTMIPLTRTLRSILIVSLLSLNCLIATKIIVIIILLSLNKNKN